MNKIKALIIDDEQNARENLHLLLNSFCKEVEVLGEAKNVDEGVELIKNLQPNLVFLDIEMPKKNGFQLLEAFEKVDFQVIFITAYDSYAIKAFQVSAVDYLLKPIDIELLQKSVKKVESTLEKNLDNNRLQLLKENQTKTSKIAVPYKNDYVIINIEDIRTIQADRMYSIIYLENNKKYIAAKKLSYYEDLFSENKSFIRVHRSWVINLNKITNYSKKEKKITLSKVQEIPLSKSYKDDFENCFSL